VLRSGTYGNLNQCELCGTRIPLRAIGRSDEQQEQKRRQAVMHHRYRIGGTGSRWLSSTGLAVQRGH
jgi:hypothetical protein